MIGEDERDTLESEAAVPEAPPPPMPLPEPPVRPYKPDTSGLWVWIAILAAFSALVWGVASQYTQFIDANAESRPFLQVTNRQMSLFLWQNPEFMRVNARQKSGYLTGFEYADKIVMDPHQADRYVAAPPWLLFRYHTWARLLREDYIARPIIAQEFLEFLEYDQAWLPDHWSTAPKEYVAFVKGLSPTSKEDLQRQPMSLLPLDVRLAFQGWKNYLHEGEQIKSIRPTFQGTMAFLKKHPHYQRWYWMNIVDTRDHKYLKDVSLATENLTDPIPDSQLSPFFSVAYYNEQMAAKGQ